MTWIIVGKLLYIEYPIQERRRVTVGKHTSGFTGIVLVYTSPGTVKNSIPFHS